MNQQFAIYTEACLDQKCQKRHSNQTNPNFLVFDQATKCSKRTLGWNITFKATTDTQFELPYVNSSTQKAS